MSLFTYNRDIPDGPNNPSRDQPKMKTNTNATDDILAVDHVSFNENNGGTHLQIHYPIFTNPTVINGAATQGSVAYTAAGVASVANSQNYFKNNFNVPLLMSSIKAFGIFVVPAATGVPTPVVLLNGINATVSQLANTFTITLSTNATTGNDVIRFVEVIGGNIISQTFVGGVLTVSLNGAQVGRSLQFLIIQA